MKSVRHRTVSLLLTAAFGAGIPLVTAPDALAASGDCASTDVCLFDNENYTGFMFARDAYWDQQVATWNLSVAGFNDRMSSWINNGPHDARWFWGANATGGSECMNSSSRNSYVGWYDNDEASSIQVYTDAGAC
ncbi:peptidase inhibitor family I36 protein [Kitasatospora cineracea]|uniref:Peptidase inhibitor family I36 n=1 Tax=Kitasatospora cineracea TaxID=88074 RepID=A0A8G1UFT0_9ACTN|nr:peptidase inhibitor family I36 protein [Kitasatospora cineracea]ROR43095.1 peptidase inhibitor family I36 [Kitasatospora cineracea]